MATAVQRDLVSFLREHCDELTVVVRDGRIDLDFDGGEVMVGVELEVLIEAFGSGGVEGGKEYAKSHDDKKDMCPLRTRVQGTCCGMQPGSRKVLLPCVRRRIDS